MNRFLAWLRAALDNPPAQPQRLSAKDALGFSFMAQSVRGLRAVPILALLLGLLVLAAFVVGKVGYWVVLTVLWLGMGGIIWHFRGQIRLSNIREALNRKDDVEQPVATQDQADPRR
ncbi:MAG: hypothetical protein K2X45_18520 [Phreatobacter sp.]|jgi:hypothetical protein|nr:hypothetical protein [Phreatobacter sp.]